MDSNFDFDITLMSWLGSYDNRRVPFAKGNNNVRMEAYIQLFKDIEIQGKFTKDEVVGIVRRHIDDILKVSVNYQSRGAKTWDEMAKTDLKVALTKYNPLKERGIVTAEDRGTLIKIPDEVINSAPSTPNLAKNETWELTEADKGIPKPDRKIDPEMDKLLGIVNE